MTSKTFALDVVSAERALFSGDVKWVFASCELGEIGVGHGHTPFVSPLQPGVVRYIDEHDEEHMMYVSGGAIEVQPDMVTILADSALRGDEIDEDMASAAEDEARSKLHDSSGDDFNHSAALNELSQAAAQMSLIRKLKNSRKG